VGNYALGIVVNPKLKVPVLVLAEGADITITAMDAEGYEDLGSGYYGMSDSIAQMLGLPRSHTPHGVTVEGQGYGTCLYTALCLGAHQNFEAHEGHPNRYRIQSYGPDGDGICSTTDDRSSEADEWWRRARRLGLAREVEEEQEEEDVDVTSNFDSLIEGESVDDGVVSRVNTISVDVSKSVSGDVYLWDSASGHHLVVADFTIPMASGAEASALWQRIGEPKLVTEVSLELILALDVRGLDISGINLLGLLAREAGASDEALHDFRFRWEAGLDPSAPVTQMQLAFKKNSSEARHAARAVREAAEYRRDAGWEALESLP
jgi:hypothetical protein